MHTLCANFCLNAHTLCETLFVWKGHKWHKKYQTSSVGFSHDMFCKKYFLIGFSWTEVRLVCASYPHRHFLASSYPWTVLASNTLVQIVMMITTTIIITIIIITIIIMSLSCHLLHESDNYVFTGHWSIGMSMRWWCGHYYDGTDEPDQNQQ